jgi:hypothetical protein
MPVNDAIIRALELAKNTNFNISLVSFGSPSPGFLKITRQFASSDACSQYCADRFGGATTAVTGYTKSSFMGVANSVFKSYEHQDGGGVDTLKHWPIFSLFQRPWRNSRANRTTD